MEKTTFFDYKPKILNDDLTENLEDYVYKRTSNSDSDFQEEPREGDAENSKILLDLDKELEKNLSTSKNVLFGDVYVRNYSVDDDERVDDSFNSYFESRNLPEIKVVDVDSNDQFTLGHSSTVKYDDLLIDIDNSSHNDDNIRKFDEADLFQDQETSSEKYSDILFPGHSAIYKEDENDNAGIESTLLNNFRDNTQFTEQPEPDFAGFFDREENLSEVNNQFSNNDFFSNSSDIQSKYSEEKIDHLSRYDNNPFRINSNETAKENEALAVSRSLENLAEHSVDDKTLFNETTDNFEQIQNITQYFNNSNSNSNNNNNNTKSTTAGTVLDNFSANSNVTEPIVDNIKQNDEHKDNLPTEEAMEEDNKNYDIFDDLLERTRNSIKLIKEPIVYGNSSSTTSTASVGKLLFSPKFSQNSDISIDNVNDKFTTEIKFSMSAPSDATPRNKSQLLTEDTKENDLFDSTLENINKITSIEDKETIIRTSEFQNGREQYLQRSLRSAMLHNNKIDEEQNDREKNNESLDRKLSLDLKANTDQIQKGISALFNIKNDETPSPISPTDQESPFPLNNPFESFKNDNTKPFDTNSSDVFSQQALNTSKDWDEKEEEIIDGYDHVKAVEVAPPLPLSEPPNRKTAPTEEIRDHIADFEMDPVTGLRRIDLQDDPVAKAQLFVEGALSPSYKIRKRSGDKPSDENIEFQKQRESIMDEMRVRKKIFNTEFLKEDIEDEVFDNKVKESERKYWQKKKDDEGKKKNSLPNIFRSINSSIGKSIIYFLFKKTSELLRNSK
ncbi:unnamed protein product [Dimorphilus gyrociliatus]|uniref:Uncharacterized protein n=1 Tax=Dimorphilus gyrociliatus TaxID=2664684 RepID=A0A7I8VC84_9ANNE|nr:unnamed protein product [Dimorphilus gyrociliatus]